MTVTAQAQKNLYVNSKWSNDNLNAAQNYISSLIGNGYSLTNYEGFIPSKVNQVRFKFINKKTNKTINIRLERGLQGGDLDMGKPADTVIRAVHVEGY